MPLELFHSAALIVAAVVVIATDKTRWVNQVAIGQLVAAVLVTLLYGDYLRLPWSHTETYISVAILAGWGAVVASTRVKPTLIAATIGVWIGALRLMLDLGWVRESALRRFLEF